MYVHAYGNYKEHIYFVDFILGWTITCTHVSVCSYSYISICIRTYKKAVIYPKQKQPACMAVQNAKPIESLVHNYIYMPCHVALFTTMIDFLEFIIAMTCIHYVFI